MTSTHFTITGMSCDGCVRALVEVLGQLAGVRDVRASLGRADVEYDDAACTIADLVAAVRRAGPFEVASFSNRAD